MNQDLGFDPPPRIIGEGYESEERAQEIQEMIEQLSTELDPKIKEEIAKNPIIKSFESF